MMPEFDIESLYIDSYHVDLLLQKLKENLSVSKRDLEKILNDPINSRTILAKKEQPEMQTFIDHLRGTLENTMPEKESITKLQKQLS